MKKTLIQNLSVAASLSLAHADLTYTTGLDVWLDASDIDGQKNSTLTDEAEVPTWTNKGTTGVNDAIAILTGGGGGNNGVLSIGGGLGGQDAIILDNTRYQFGQEWGDSPDITAYFVVYQGANPTAQGALLTDYGDIGNKLRNLRTGSGSAGAYLRDSTGETNSIEHGNVTLANEKWATIFYSYDSSTNTATWGELGNTTSATNANFDGTTTFEGTHGGPVTLFCFHDGNNGWDFNGLVSEVLIYDHTLDANARASVESYLESKANPSAPGGPDITEISVNADGSVTLTWDSNPAQNTNYTIYLSEDLALPLANWSDVEDGLPTDGESTSYTIESFSIPEGATKVFFRVAENE